MIESACRKELRRTVRELVELKKAIKHTDIKEMMDLKKTIKNQDIEIDKLLKALFSKGDRGIYEMYTKMTELYVDSQARELEYHRFLQMMEKEAPQGYKETVIEYQKWKAKNSQNSETS